MSYDDVSYVRGRDVDTVDGRQEADRGLAVPAVPQVAHALVLGHRVQPRRVDGAHGVGDRDHASYGVGVVPRDLADLHPSRMTR